VAGDGYDITGVVNGYVGVGMRYVDVSYTAVSIDVVDYSCVGIDVRCVVFADTGNGVVGVTYVGVE